jgi:hypothetical protein
MLELNSKWNYRKFRPCGMTYTSLKT